MVVRRQFELDSELSALRLLAEQVRLEALDGPLLELSPQHNEELQEFQRLSLEEAQVRQAGLSKEVLMQMALLGIRERAANPYWFSDLPKWLGFETWKPKDALLLLSGVSPLAAIVDWTYENFMGGVVDSPRIRAASDLDAIYDDYDLPSRDSWDDEIADIQKKLRLKETISDSEEKHLREALERLEGMRDGSSLIRREAQLRHRSRILSALSSQWFSGDHDADRRYTPEHFIAWARIRGFTPEWYDWAVSQGILEATESISGGELFNPDSDDYPELLHIAVRAWEFARKDGSGTPKQRIEAFLSERYSKLSPNARAGIAQVANWQRTGGRPKA